MGAIPLETAPVQDRYLTYEQMNLINSFRSFTMDMEIFKRFVASCIIIFENCFDALFARLLQVPYESFQQMSTYLGGDAAEKYLNQINQHIIIMVELLKALKAGNQQEVDELVVKWYQNADSTASYMASVNPYWSREQWQSLLYRDLSMTLSQAMAMTTKDYSKSVEIFDQLRFHSILMGDYMARGMMQLLNVQPPQVVLPEPVRSPAGPIPPARSFR